MPLKMIFIPWKTTPTPHTDRQTDKRTTSAHMACLTCVVSSALISHMGTKVSDYQIYKGTAQTSAHCFTSHSPNDTLDALCEHANATAWAPRMQSGRLADGKQNKPSPRMPFTELSACPVLRSCNAWAHNEKTLTRLNRLLIFYTRNCEVEDWRNVILPAGECNSIHSFNTKRTINCYLF